MIELLAAAALTALGITATLTTLWAAGNGATPADVEMLKTLAGRSGGVNRRNVSR